MRPVSARLANNLDIDGAIRREAAAQRNLVPAEVEWSRIENSRARIKTWIVSQLREGYAPARQQVTIARKSQGTRPVAILGITERVIYRALVDYVLGPGFQFDRSAEAYLNFVRAPVQYGQDLQRQASSDALRTFFFLDSDIEYVVKSDIVAFYQYVDHAVLAEELRVRGGDFDAIVHLIELLQDLQGRTYGLPQLLDSSDHLSEVYIDRVERHMLRKGIPTWRFNDDFRMACGSYPDALAAIEELDTAARSVGLVISDSKTFTYRFMNYMIDSLALEIQPGQSSVALDDIEAAIGDYTDDFSQDAEAATNFIRRATPLGGEDASVNLHKVGHDGLRLLRRAIQSLTRVEDPNVLDDVQRLFTYVPALTPALLTYLSAVASTATNRALRS